MRAMAPVGMSVPSAPGLVVSLPPASAMAVGLPLLVQAELVQPIVCRRTRNFEGPPIASGRFSSYIIDKARQ